MPAELPPLLRPPARQGWRVLLLLALVAIGWLALTPEPPRAAGVGWDKARHLLAFGTLALCASLAFFDAERRTLNVVLALLAYGAAIELVQTQVPGRQGEWLDLLADALGIAAGLLLAQVLTHRHNR